MMQEARKAVTGFFRRERNVLLSILAVYMAARLVMLSGLVLPWTMTNEPSSAGPYVARLEDYVVQKHTGWDSGWYEHVANVGYQYEPDRPGQYNVAFFPLYPYVAKAFAALTGLRMTGTMLILSSLYSLLACGLLFFLLRDMVPDRVAWTTVSLLLFYPGAIFLYFPYTESLFLLLAVAFVWFLNRERLVAAALVSGLLTATRVQGVVFALVLAAVLLHRRFKARDLSPRALPALAGYGLLSVSGLLLFCALLGYKFGDPLAFIKTQAGWGGQDSLYHAATFTSITKAFEDLAHNPLMLFGQSTLNSMAFVFTVLGSLVLLARKFYPLALLGLGLALLSYVPAAGRGMMSYMRFADGNWPAFLGVALLLDRFPPAVRHAVLGILSALLVTFAAYWAVGKFVA